jgi:hypothetical protein
MSDKDLNGMMEKEAQAEGAGKELERQENYLLPRAKASPTRDPRVTHACPNPSEGCVCRGGFQPL